ncbi:MAG: phosphoribosylglycinamide formyltransferase [Alphaproteobacteria bacterium]|nr:phosphoribosylglycinamide formyltransferase [Alphaproteobacteria bacterium]
MTARRRVGVLISGRGSNMKALIEAAAAKNYPAEIVLVLSNRADAAGLAIAAGAGVKTQVIAHQDFADRAAFDAALDAALRAAGVEIVCLAGFMRLFTPGFVEQWRGRMLNIHPSLLPSFPGLDPHGQAIAAGVRFSGCTVHFVTPAMDSGPIIAQAAVPVHAGDTAQSLATRVLAAEHRLYPMALALVAQGRARMEGDRAVLDAAAAPQEAVFNPLLSS